MLAVPEGRREHDAEYYDGDRDQDGVIVEPAAAATLAAPSVEVTDLAPASMETEPLEPSLPRAASRASSASSPFENTEVIAAEAASAAVSPVGEDMVDDEQASSGSVDDNADDADAVDAEQDRSSGTGSPSMADAAGRGNKTSGFTATLTTA